MQCNDVINMLICALLSIENSSNIHLHPQFHTLNTVYCSNIVGLEFVLFITLASAFRKSEWTVLEVHVITAFHYKTSEESS